MSNPPSIALDLDGVVVDLAAEIIRRLVEEGHAAPTWNAPPTFSWKTAACGLTVEAGIRAHTRRNTASAATAAA